ncbi:MAG: GNAT family N-acetyltransferase [Deltaproteobacteria bacterium]|nr:GNAT family N-acetyltransferase [Deltaproteobacteria bacterium]
MTSRKRPSDSHVTIRKLKKADATSIARIDKSITKTVSQLDFGLIAREEMKRALATSFVAELDGNVVGYMISYITSGNFGVDRCAWIAMFGVEPKLMGQGIGKSLAEEVFKFYRAEGVTDVFTTVRWDSTDILSFFKTLGFDRSNFINLRKDLDI